MVLYLTAGSPITVGNQPFGIAIALRRLMEQYQQFDPFKFLIYAELAGAEIGPVE